MLHRKWLARAPDLTGSMAHTLAVRCGCLPLLPNAGGRVVWVQSKGGRHGGWHENTAPPTSSRSGMYLVVPGCTVGPVARAAAGGLACPGISSLSEQRTAWPRLQTWPRRPYPHLTSPTCPYNPPCIMLSRTRLRVEASKGTAENLLPGLSTSPAESEIAGLRTPPHYHFRPRSHPCRHRVCTAHPWRRTKHQARWLLRASRTVAPGG